MAVSSSEESVPARSGHFWHKSAGTGTLANWKAALMRNGRRTWPFGKDLCASLSGAKRRLHTVHLACVPPPPLLPSSTQHPSVTTMAVSTVEFLRLRYRLIGADVAAFVPLQPSSSSPCSCSRTPADPSCPHGSGTPPWYCPPPFAGASSPSSGPGSAV